jgi:hypothetical protein
VWQERQRRYQVHDEVGVIERHLSASLDELGTLGITMLEPETGRIGFPTLVNDRRAFFSWQPG